MLSRSLATAALGLLILAGCGGGESDRSPATEFATTVPAGGLAQDPEVLDSGEGLWTKCHPDPDQGGGFDVWAANIDCGQALDWILRLGGDPEGLRKTRINRLEDSWECQIQIEQKFGPVHNICIRGNQAITFRWA